MNEEEFFSRCIPEHNSGCWLWEGSISAKGYGQFTNRKLAKRTVLAHRFSWELHRSKIPDETQVLHRCDVRCCVNPDHLFLGTPLDNVLDMHAKQRARPPRGDNHYRMKLSDEDIANIRKDARRIADIARAYGLSRQRIWSIRNDRVRKYKA